MMASQTRFRFLQSSIPLTLCLLLLLGVAEPALVTAQPAEPFFPIIESDQFGFINASGQVIITPQYEGAQASSEGLAAVRAGDQWGFIDAANAMVIPAQFEAVFPFAEGRARVRLGRHWGFIDHTGHFVADARYLSALDYAQQRAPVKGQAGQFDN